MHEIKDSKTQTEIECYQGVPNGSSPNKKPAWKKFLHAIFPWFNKNWKLGERLMEAEVHKKEAEAFSTHADGELKMQQAKKISTETAILEKEKLNSIDINHISITIIEEHMRKMEEKIKFLSVVHGTIVEIKSDDDSTSNC